MALFKAHIVPIRLSKRGRMANDSKPIITGMLRIQRQIHLKGNRH